MVKLVFVVLVLLGAGPLSPREEELVEQASQQGRSLVPDAPDARVSPERLIAPGQPPLLSFRYFEGKSHHRFGNGELMLDDAGH